jgi:anti-sigma factor RsiW
MPENRSGDGRADGCDHPAHLSTDEIVGYIDQRVTEAVRRQVECHLASCNECLRELIAVTRFLHKNVPSNLRVFIAHETPADPPLPPPLR